MRILGRCLFVWRDCRLLVRYSWAVSRWTFLASQLVARILEEHGHVVDLFGMVKWPFQRLSDLQLGDQKVTLNHLGVVFLLMCFSFRRCWSCYLPASLLFLTVIRHLLHQKHPKTLDFFVIPTFDLLTTLIFEVVATPCKFSMELEKWWFVGRVSNGPMGLFEVPC